MKTEACSNHGFRAPVYQIASDRRGLFVPFLMNQRVPHTHVEVAVAQCALSSVHSSIMP